MTATATAILIDGSHLIYRSASVFHAFSTSNGYPTGTLFGVMRAIEHLKKTWPAATIIFVLDGSPANRRQLSPTYKANRTSNSDVYHCLTDNSLQNLLAAAGINTSHHPDYECDDLIAMWAEVNTNDNISTIIYSGDDDFCQLANPTTKIYKPHPNRLLTEADVFLEWNVHPKSLPLYRSFTGDSSDSIEGIPRINRDLLQLSVRDNTIPAQFYDDQPIFETFFPEKWQQVIRAFRPQCEINFRLTKLPWDTLPSIPLTKNTLNPQELEAIFKHLEFNSMLKKMDSLISLLSGATLRKLW